MNRDQALAAAKRRLGNRAIIEANPSAPDAEGRRAQQVRKGELFRAKDAAYKARQARVDALLEADPEYQRLHAEFRRARVEWEAAPHGIDYRCTIGVDNGYMSVRAQGDTWTEALQALERKAEAGD